MALSERDRLRLEISDTELRAPLFTDDELDVLLEENSGRPLAAAAAACEILARRFAMKADLWVKAKDSEVRRTYSGMAKTYADLAKDLRARVQTATGAPWLGGGSKARKDALAADSDRVQPTFQRGQFNTPGT